MIKNIDISKIHHHPDNPRKDLGDLTELAESIKERGVLQNLTLVPIEGKEDEYYAVIGNRRLAASKLAGLTEVPAAIDTMDYKTQIATMLLENIQREDLTVYEQAQGFQMMIDLGETVHDISQKTGFSESTVRHRTKLLELDPEKFKKSTERGATLMDYVELEKIKDLELRNEVLQHVGTDNFKWKLRNAIDEEKSRIRKQALIAKLEKFAEQTDNSAGLKYINTYYFSQNEDIEVPSDVDTVKHFFFVGYGSITLYREQDRNKTEANNNSKEWEEKLRLRRERQSVLDEISNRAYMLRYDFVRNLSASVIKKNLGIIIEMLVSRVIDDDYCSPDIEPKDYADFFDIKLREEESEDDDPDEIYKTNLKTIRDQVKEQPELHLLAMTYLLLDSSREKYYDWNNKCCENESLDRVYELIESLGYKKSDEERALASGTHELFEE